MLFRSDWAQISKNSRKICEMKYEDLKARFPKEDSKIRLTACFRAVWANVFLIHGLKMPKDYEKLKTVSKINGADIDWTLGAVLDKSLAIEEAVDDEPDPSGDAYFSLS